MIVRYVVDTNLYVDAIRTDEGNAALARFQRRLESWVRAALILTRLVERGLVTRGGFSRSFLNDWLIAATAREHGFVLVTRNTRDYELIRRVERGVRVEAPWPGD